MCVCVCVCSTGFLFRHCLRIFHGLFSSRFLISWLRERFTGFLPSFRDAEQLDRGCLFFFFLFHRATGGRIFGAFSFFFLEIGLLALKRKCFTGFLPSFRAGAQLDTPFFPFFLGFPFPIFSDYLDQFVDFFLTF